MSATSYLRPARDGEAMIEVKRSKFLATVKRVPDEASARALVEQMRRLHFDARHHCSAFVLGPDAAVQRSSDDGEPAGTAGAPMLEVLRGWEGPDGLRGVSDVVVVVTRWFGGVLLGAGGLVRAYSDAVQAALHEVGVVRTDLVEEWQVNLDHADAGRVESELRVRGVEVLGVTWGESVVLGLGVRDAAALQVTLAEVTAGRVAAVRTGERWVDLR